MIGGGSIEVVIFAGIVTLFVDLEHFCVARELARGTLCNRPRASLRATQNGYSDYVRYLFAIIVCLVTLSVRALNWESAATGSKLNAELFEPSASDHPLPTVVYLKNLSIARIGQEADESIIGDLVKSGHLVLVLDYAHHPKAISPDLNADILKLREAIADAKHKTLLADHNVDVNHLFFLVEGFRLKRDIEFARDADRVLGMDICYPSNPTRPVPILLEITCDNVNRMGSYSLLFCHDTLLEGAQAAGFATAMVDHPVAPPYKGIDDPMPQSIERMESAVRALRAFSRESKASEKIGAIGFSRGGPFAATLAAHGSVAAALIHGNRYDFMDLLPNDPMLPRFEKAWGKRDENKERWAAHGAANYLTGDCAPMFLNTSNAESPEYRDGLAKFDKWLTRLQVEHVYQVDPDGRGHRVSTDPETLAKIYHFFATHLEE